METEEIAHHDEHWGMYGNAGSLHHTPKTNTTPYANYSGIKIYE